jgi:hypothetical protein
MPLGFLNELSCCPNEPGSKLPPMDVGITIQLLTLRPLAGFRAHETELGIAVPPGMVPRERYVFPAAALFAATERSPAAELTQPPSGGLGVEASPLAGRAQFSIGEFVSVTRLGGAAPRGAPEARERCIIPTGSVLLGTVCCVAPSIASLGEVIARLDAAAMHALRGVDGRPSACQLDIVELVGGTLQSPPPTSTLLTVADEFLSYDRRSAVSRWPTARHRLEGRRAREVAAHVASGRSSSSSP